MTRWNHRFVGAGFAIAVVIAVAMSVSLRAKEERIIHVSGVNDLYAAINDPNNAGGRIVLASGTYFLDPTAGQRWPA